MHIPGMRVVQWLKYLPEFEATLWQKLACDGGCMACDGGCMACDGGCMACDRGRLACDRGWPVTEAGHDGG